MAKRTDKKPIDPDVRELMDALEAERIARGMSVTEMIARAGISMPTWWGWRHGRYEPHLSTFLQALRALGMGMAVKGESGMTVIRPRRIAQKGREPGCRG